MHLPLVPALQKFACLGAWWSFISLALLCLSGGGQGHPSPSLPLLPQGESHLEKFLRMNRDSDVSGGFSHIIDPFRLLGSFE